MDTFETALHQAAAKLLADNLTLTEEAAGKVCAEASVRLLQEICKRALDPSVEDTRALGEMRALCTQAQLFFREQGL